VEKESELERYLATPIIDFDDDILVWWKQWAHEYPCLARIARDYLAIPATSVPAERASVLGWSRSGHQEARIVERGYHPSLHVSGQLV
jgi:hypothetical protein